MEQLSSLLTTMYKRKKWLGLAWLDDDDDDDDDVTKKFLSRGS
jgi:hypothetical protein